MGRLESMDFALEPVGMLGGVRFSIAAPETKETRPTTRMGIENFMAVGMRWKGCS